MLGAAALLLAGCGGPSGSARQVTVTGNGSTTAVPDRLDFSFSVDSRAATARAAISRNGAAAARIVAALRAAGIAERDLQTQAVSVSPEVENRRVLDYVASTTVAAKIRDFDSAGTVLDAATKAGATGIDGPNLVVSRTKALYRVALARAVADARTKAAALARASGRSLGRILSVDEAGSAPTPLESATARGPAAKIEPGTQEIDASVTVSFALR